MSTVPVTGFIDQAEVDKIVRTQVERAIAAELGSSKVIDTAVKEAMTVAMPTITASIADAIDKAMTMLLNDPTFIAKLIGDALMKDTSKLSGAFDSALRAAGKRMALDAGTLGKVVESVSEQIAAEADLRALEYLEKGGGSFS